MQTSEQLSKQDQERVDSVINSGYNDTERRPFRFWRLFAILWGIVTLIGLIAIWMGHQVGTL